jgi:hypothetical protein
MMHSIDLNDHQIELRKVGRHPVYEFLVDQGDKPTGDHRFQKPRTISFRCIARCFRKPASRAAFQLGTRISLPWRSTSIMPPGKPTFPLVVPQRWPRFPGPRAYRGVEISSASSLKILIRLSTPSIRPKPSKLFFTSPQSHFLHPRDAGNGGKRIDRHGCSSIALFSIFD